MKALAALALTLFVVSALAQDKTFAIGEIEFYGYSHFQLDRIRTALAFHEGDVIAIPDFPAAKEKIRESVKREVGRDAMDVSFVCCDNHANLMIYIGLPGDSSRRFRYNALPKGSVRLPRSILDLYDRAMDLTMEAVQKQPAEDNSKGYGLSAYPPLRETQLAIRKFAIHNELLIRSRLRSSAEPGQRRAAAHGLARHHVDIVVGPGEQPAVAQRAGVGRQPHAKAALDQLDAERFGRKQMAAGAAGRQQDERRVVHEGLLQRMSRHCERGGECSFRAPGAAQRAALRGVMRC